LQKRVCLAQMRDPDRSIHEDHSDQSGRRRGMS
jgi:hypothetical protein